MIGDKQLSDAMPDLQTNVNLFQHLSEIEAVEIRACDAILAKHIPVGLVDSLNHHRYLPKFIIVHVSAANFACKHNALQRHNIAFMIQENKCI